MTQPFLTPKKNFDYINRVNKTNWKYFLYIFLRLQPWKRPLRLNIMAFCLEHPKWHQRPKFTPLSETTSIPLLSYGSAPPPPKPVIRTWVNWLLSRGVNNNNRKQEPIKWSLHLHSFDELLQNGRHLKRWLWSLKIGLHMRIWVGKFCEFWMGCRL